KVIVATQEEELPRLDELLRRGTANAVPALKMLNAEQLKELEPFAHGIRALHVPGTGIVDFSKVAEIYAQKIIQAGGTIATRQECIRAALTHKGLIVTTRSNEYSSRHLINCAGLFSDRIAKILAQPSDFNSESETRIVPFRGEYYQLVRQRASRVKNLIYP